jgi:hypothetical protein
MGDFGKLLGVTISAETEIRNQIAKKPDIGRSELLKTILLICTKFGIREEIEQKANKGILPDAVWDALASMYLHQNKFPEQRVEYSGTRSFTKKHRDEKIRCEWPGCDIQDDLQKDHIIPKSVLTDEMKRRGGANWQINGQWLCPFHNRLKTDSILIGIIML